MRTRHGSRLCFRTFAVIALLLSCAAVADSSYHIGNSLTWDMYMPALQQIASSLGESLTPGYHIRASKSLVYILNNPGDVTIASPAIWPTALPAQQWRFVTFEPYPDPVTPSTLQTDITAAQTFIGLTLKASGPGALFFIYEAWPDQNAFLGDYDAYWNQTIPNNLDQRTLLARQYFDALFQRLTAQYGNAATLRVIPVGDVLARINQLIVTGQFQGASNVTDFYRDTYHMGSAGRFMAAITAFATMYGRNPGGAPYAPYLQFNDGKVILTSQMAAQLESIVWDVVTSNSARTGVDPTQISPTSLSFQSTPIGASSQAQTIVISNIGSRPVALGTILAPPNYGVSTTCGNSLPANTQCSVSVTFAPTISGALSGDLTISSEGVQHAVALAGSSPVTATISASAATATVGQPLTLTWSSTPGATCEAQASAASSPWSGSVATSSAKTFTESAPGTLSYSLACTASGVSSASAAVPVTWSWPPVGVTLSAMPTTITEGQVTSISWTSSNATSCSATGGGPNDGWPGVKPTAGTQSVTESAPPTNSASLTFTLSCSSSISLLAKTAAVTVVDSPPPMGSPVAGANLPPKSGGGGAMDVVSLLAAAGILCCRRRSKACSGWFRWADSQPGTGCKSGRLGRADSSRPRRLSSKRNHSREL